MRRLGVRLETRLVPREKTPDRPFSMEKPNGGAIGEDDKHKGSEHEPRLPNSRSTRFCDYFGKSVTKATTYARLTFL